MDNNQYFFNIQQRYGTATRNNFRAIQRLTEKLSSNVSRDVFLLKCRRYEIIPQFIINKTASLFSPYSDMFPETNTMQSHLRNKILDFEITICNRSRRKLLMEISRRKMCLSDCQQDAQPFLESIEQSYDRSLARNNEALNVKFTHLLKAQGHLPDIKYDESFVKNTTNLEIPHEMSVILSLGPKFALKPDRLPIPEIITDLEYIVSRYSHPNLVNAVRGQLTYTLTKYSKKADKQNRIQLFLKRAAMITAKFLKDHPDIFISNSDKGNKTVICYRHEYESKMLELLRDTTQFQPIDKDPTSTCETKLNNHLKTIQDKHSINKKQRLRLQSTTAIPPRVFGQYKIHKERADGQGHPLRLITSTIKTVSYNTSKEITNILTKAYAKPKFTIKNSWQALNAIRNKRILRSHRLASFDMENCFGSISTELAMQLISQDFSEKIQPHTTIEKCDFMELLRICLEECNYLLYQGQFYRQLNGIFMGNSLGSIIVQIVTEHIINEVINQLKKEKIIPPSVWIVYVDDHLVICRETVIDEILKRLNAFDPGRIKFTCELEDNGSINFLDLTIKRLDGVIYVRWI